MQRNDLRDSLLLESFLAAVGVVIGAMVAVLATGCWPGGSPCLWARSSA